MSLPYSPTPSSETNEPTLTGAPLSPVKPGKSIWREIVETLLLTVFIYVAVNFSTGRFRVEGESMSPTFHTNQYVVIDKLSYLLGQPDRGDIVVFRYPFSQPNNERDFIKRIIGLPGETVQIEGGVVRVNGQPLEEPYIQTPPAFGGTWTLGADEYFVMGDNRNNSSDSRSWGPLKREFIIGRALFVYWPLEAIRWVPHHDYTATASPATP